MQVAAALLGQALAGVVDHHAAHGRGGVGEEVRAIVELRRLAPDQLEVGLVHQRGRIQRVGLLARQLAPSHGVQFLVERRQDAVQRAPVTFAGGIQPLRDLGNLAHRSLALPRTRAI